MTAITRKSNNYKVLMIGPMYSGEGALGGCVVAFEEMVKALNEFDDLAIDVVSTSRPRTGLLRRLYLTVNIYRNIQRAIINADVVALFTTNTSLRKTVPMVSRLCRSHSKPLLIRKFGGPSHRCMPPEFKVVNKKMLSKIVTMLLKADVYIPETYEAYLAARADRILNTLWMPNYRTMPTVDVQIPSNRQCRKYVYVGDVKPSKGLNELIQASELLPKDVTVDVYGFLLDGMTEDDFRKGPETIRYRGALETEDVIPTLRKYDVFVFPTYFSGEGHSGVIMEAFAAGLPVITTAWKNIPEVVDDSSGILVAPRNYKELHQAILRLYDDREMYQTLCEGVRQRSRLFSTSIWAEVFAEFCRTLASGEAITEAQLDTYHRIPKQLKRKD
jgi:glycosyltransferase involved in cell wall biosynthesis